MEGEHGKVEHQLHVGGHVLRNLVGRTRHVGLLQGGTPAFEALFLGGAFNALLDVAHRLQVFVELLLVAAGDLRLQITALLQDGVQDAAIELPAFAVADELIEGARGVDLFGGGLGGRGPRNGRTIEHGEAIFEAQFIGLDAEHQAGNRGVSA